jgi:ketosteroid isomerase-like protein
MKLFVFRFAAFGILLTGCQTFRAPLSVDQANDERLIRFAEQDWVDVTLKGDATAFSAYLADTYVALGSSGRLTDKATWTNRIRGGTTHYDEVVLRDLTVRFPSPDIAVVTGSYSQKGIAEGKDNSGAGIYINTWARLDGKWKVVSSGFVKPTAK